MVAHARVGLGLAFPRLDSILFHGDGSIDLSEIRSQMSLARIRRVKVTYIVQFEVQAARIAHWVPLIVSSPERGGRGLAVGTGQANAPIAGRLLAWPVLLSLDGVRFAYSASIAQKVATAIASPEWSGHGAAVDALASRIVAIVLLRLDWEH